MRVLERFSFLSVPQADAERVVEKVTGERVNGATLKVEAVGA